MLSTFLSARDTFMLEMHLRQLGFTYSACGPLPKKKEKMQKLKETGDLRHIYQNELDKSCFQHDMAYGDFKDLPRKAASDKVLRDKAFNLLKTQNMMNMYIELHQWFIHFLIKSLPTFIKSKIISNQELAEKLHKLIIRKFENRKVYLSLKDNIWGVDLTNIKLIRKFNKGIRFLLCVIDIYSKYAWVAPLKDK